MKTREKYAMAMEDFNTFLAQSAAAGNIFANYDDALSDHIASLRRERKGRQDGNLASAGLKFFRPGSRLPKSSRSLRAWEADEPANPWPCLPEAAVVVLILRALQRGWINIAGYLSASFVCLPRVSAASRIVKDDVALPGDPRFAKMGAECFIVIARDKRQKSPRIVDVYDELCVELLSLLVETQPAEDNRLFRACSTTLRRKLKVLCRELGWSHLNFVPHSLRYGGAVHDKAVRNLHVGDIQQRGRWKNADTCLAYIQKGLGSLFALKFPRSSHKEMRNAPKIRKKMLRVLRRARRAPRGV